jgi:hypothetical protein
MQLADDEECRMLQKTQCHEGGGHTEEAEQPMYRERRDEVNRFKTQQLKSSEEHTEISE